MLRVASCKLRKVCEDLETNQSQEFNPLAGNRPDMAQSDRFVLRVRGLDVDLLPGVEDASIFHRMFFPYSFRARKLQR